MAREKLTDDEVRTQAGELSEEWTVAEGQRLERTVRFPDFAQGLAFTNRVGALAEEANHHPDILLTWGRVTLTLWTDDAGGLTHHDFALAKQIDAVVTPPATTPRQD
ncbi:MAG TPA: 4a-hydroxytetrahydrobiopterin dehydratase [Thermoanaerobaculia bacterium]